MHWTESQKQYVIDHVNSIPVEDIAAHIGRSSRAVRLFLHRNKISLGKTVKHNLTLAVLERKFGRPEYFNPTKLFFADVKINQKRWWDLYYGRKQITQEEYNRLCAHLNVSPEDKFESRQIKLFE